MRRIVSLVLATVFCFGLLQVLTLASPQVPLVVKIVAGDYQKINGKLVKLGEEPVANKTVYLVADLSNSSLVELLNYKATAVAQTDQNGFAFFNVVPSSLVKVHGIAFSDQVAGLYGPVYSYFIVSLQLGKINVLDINCFPPVKVPFDSKLSTAFSGRQASAKTDANFLKEMKMEKNLMGDGGEQKSGRRTPPKLLPAYNEQKGKRN